MSLHFLVTSWSAPGHINPVIQLAQCLVEAKFWKPPVFVTLGILINENTQGKIQLPNHSRIRNLTIDKIGIRDWILDMDRRSMEAAEEIIIKLEESNPEWPAVGTVVSDILSGFGPIIARQLEVPLYVFCPSPLTSLYSILNLSKLRALRETANPPEEFPIPGIGEFPLPRNFPDDSSNPMVSWFSRMLETCTKSLAVAQGCLVNDVQSFYSSLFLSEIQSAISSNALCCGPLCLQDPRVHNGLSPEIEQFLIRFPARSILFIALGSSWSIPNQSLVELAHGIAAAGRPFVFVHRGQFQDDPFPEYALPNPPASEPTDPEGLPICFRSETCARGLVVRWVNQPAILCHESVGVFMTHCGWNSVLEGVSFGGVPMLLLPVGGDQPINAAFIDTHLQCGKSLWGSKHELRRDSVKQLINTVFEDLSLRKRAADLKVMIQQETAPSGVMELNLMQWFNQITRNETAR
eukprot:Gregarina_sp_Poly_1__11444@NODE_979_length_5480_cov_217_286902_g691_i0_p2_GENE_NODE_979_length_5480_cov_217_286902_g691_i0NODE_979_length_5480_cov_217_286902_g691_i0_p2_ORF_typecomplete_len464_score49_79UDPGT/PF00201_18/4_7e38Glyco_tran_28_C/PF04101_16/0_022_NODE_979_length_5480_cov_217_286902_g691_i023453736